jgi:hypothetical protein
MSLRKAALILHAMSETDQLWALAQLAPNKRAELAPLLAELVELGIPGDDSLLEDAFSPSSAPDVRELVAVEEVVDRMAVHHVCTLLRDEPAPFVAKLLDARAWPWADEVAQRLGVERAGGPAAEHLARQAAQLMMEKAAASSSLVRQDDGAVRRVLKKVFALTKPERRFGGGVA